MPAALIERGLQAAVEDLADRLPVRVDLFSALGDSPLPASVESSAYLVVAEAVTNAVKHAHCERIDIRLERRIDRLLVEVWDDGRGGADFTAGTGLSGLADRLRALDGTLLLRSAPGKGTCVRAEIPCD
jgi:signal transduction histidine kinase